MTYGTVSRCVLDGYNSYKYRYAAMILRKNFKRIARLWYEYMIPGINTET
jgi:hypothetical protein